MTIRETAFTSAAIATATFGIGAGWYNFLPIIYLGDSNYRGYYAHRHDNFRLINHTTNVTNLNVNRSAESGSFGGVTLGGPSFLQANAQSQTPIERANLAFHGSRRRRRGQRPVAGALRPPRRRQHAAGSAALKLRARHWPREYQSRHRYFATAPRNLAALLRQPNPARNSAGAVGPGQCAPAEAKVATMNTVVGSREATPADGDAPDNFRLRVHSLRRDDLPWLSGRGGEPDHDQSAFVFTGWPGTLFYLALRTFRGRRTVAEERAAMPA